jgi:hypothetical protein
VYDRERFSPSYQEFPSMMTRFFPSSWRYSLSALAVIATTACAGSSSPTSPSRLTADVDSGASVTSAQSHTAAKPLSGTAGTVFVEVEEGSGLFGFPAGTLNGESGRLVTLTGDIEGINFEPGVCNPGVDMTFGPTFCVVFGVGPGQFTRARTGGTAFTTCACTVAGIGNPGDQFILKISYPPATPPKYPFGFTKFTFQGGTGALSGLRGQGTLDFAANPAVTFNYHFVAN